MKMSILEDRHRRVSKALNHALTLQDSPDAWSGLATVLRFRFSWYERSCLLTALVKASEPEALFEVVNRVLPTRLAGAPLPVFGQIDDDARWWANLATPPEFRAYLAACFVRLPAREQDAFLGSAKRRADS